MNELETNHQQATFVPYLCDISQSILVKKWIKKYPAIRPDTLKYPDGY